MTKSKYYKNIYQRKTRPWKWGILLIQGAVFIFLLLLMGGTAVFVYYAKDLPRPEKFTELAIAQPTKIYDRSGQVLLYEVFGEEKREILPLSQIPEHFKQAVIATEDAEFYNHFGISVRGTARALLTNLGIRHSRNRTQGGSTITQQLARSSFLTREKTITRKLRELALTIELERRYSKDQILEFYLNQIPFGANTYGVGAASEQYFKKKPDQLSLSESAALVALVSAPSYYSPYGPHLEELLFRKNYVFDRMVQERFLSSQEAEKAKQQKLVFQEPTVVIRAPHFVMHTMDYLLATYGEDFLRASGLKVFTSLDWNLQQEAEQSLQAFAERNKGFGAHNAALVAIKPATGEVLAMVGSKDWFADSFPKDCTSGKNCLFDPKVNAATYLQGRQPGSAFKPFVYATAFKKGHNDQEIVVDEETNLGIWGGKEYIPQNYDGRFRGPVTLRQALAQSLNIPSIKVLLELAGIEESIHTATEMGITTLTDASSYGPALVLGGGEVRLLDMVSAYGVFANSGRKILPVTILKIEDWEGNILEKNRSAPIQILPPEVAQQITSILTDNEARAPIFGRNSLLSVPGYEVAVKTGTTQDYRDGWTIGYTSNLATGVWAGNNDNSPTSREPGVAIAAPIWNRFMVQALSYLKSKP